MANLTLFLYLLLFAGLFIYGLIIGLREKSGKAGETMVKKYLSGEQKDLSFNFGKQREKYLAELPDESRTVVEKSRQLIAEAKTLIGGADCNVQKLNSKIEEKLSEAVSLANQALELSPESPYTHYNLAYAYNWSHCYSFGGDDKALLEYQKAIELDQDFLEARSNLGAIYKNLANYQAAIPHLEYVTQKAPLCGYCWMDLGEAYLRYGAKSRAKEALDTASGLIDEKDKERVRVDKLLDELNSQQ